MRVLLLSVLASLCSMWFADTARTNESGSRIGQQIEDFTIKDFRGKRHALSDYDNKRAVVVYFMGTECPLAKLYGPRMQKLSNEFAARRVAFLGINSNLQDSITELAAHARIHEITFPLLKDLGTKVADRFGATRTPEVFVLDAERFSNFEYRARNLEVRSRMVRSGRLKPGLQRRA